MNRRVTDEHGDGRDDFEIDQRLDAEAADFFQIGVAGDSDNENTEEQRRDDDLDEAQENSAEELQIHRDGGRVVAEFRAGEKADENPSRQRTARSGIRRDEKNCEPTEERWDQRGQRQNLSAGEQRYRDSDRCGDGCRGEELIFHRRSTKDSIDAERYAG